jgi:hypothetical protein
MFEGVKRVDGCRYPPECEGPASVPELQAIILNFRVGADTGHLKKLLRYSPGNVRKSAVALPGELLDGGNAAKSGHIVQK